MMGHNTHYLLSMTVSQDVISNPFAEFIPRAFFVWRRADEFAFAESSLTFSFQVRMRAIYP